MANGQQSEFGWYEHMTGDLDRAIRFYGDVVGWEIRDSGMPGMRYMMFGKGGKDVGGMASWAEMGQTGKAPKWAGNLLSTNIHEQSAAMVADGAKLFRPLEEIPGIGWYAVMADQQGAEFMLFQPMDTTAAPPRLKPSEAGGVGWCELSTTDWEQAWNFYSKHCGWTKDMAVDMGSMGTYQTFKLGPESGGGMMNLWPGAGGVQRPGWLFYITLDDIGAAAERVRASGGQVTHGPAPVPGGSWILQGTDPEGCAFALTAAK